MDLATEYLWAAGYDLPPDPPKVAPVAPVPTIKRKPSRNTSK